jgi:hypothetical protein
MPPHISKGEQVGDLILIKLTLIGFWNYFDETIDSDVLYKNN